MHTVVGLHVQLVAGAVPPVAIRDDRRAIGALLQGANAEQERAGQQKVVIVERGEPRRRHHRATCGECGGKATRLSHQQRHATIFPERALDIWVATRSIEHDDHRRAHAVLRERARDRGLERRRRARANRASG